MIASSSLLPPTRIDCDTTIPPSEITATSVVPPPMSTIMLPEGPSTGKPAPMAAAIGSSMMSTERAPARFAASRTARSSTDVISAGTQMTTEGLGQEDRGQKRAVLHHFLDEIAQHHFGHLEVGDDAVAQRPDRLNMRGRLAQHLTSFLTHGKDFVGADVYRDHGRLAQNDPFPLHVDQYVGSAEVNPDVDGECLSR